MSDIELVIKLDEEYIKRIDKLRFLIGGTEDRSLQINVINAIKTGIPLSKGHGRLGDLDALREEVSSWGMNDYEPSDFTDEIDRTDTIIPADKVESEDNGNDN
jgi:hypothetical protein